MRQAPICGGGRTLAFSQLDDLKQEVEALEGLDLDLLRRRWRSLMGRPAPAHLARGLLLRILAYQLQIAQLGDLDRETRIALGAQIDEAQRLALAPDLDADKRRKAKAVRSVTLRPGTVLEREYGGVLHRVTVTKDGCSWNGQSFRSLSEAACTITGTKWNGPRFFGLRSTERATVNAGACALKQAGGSASALGAEAAR
jgi:hypothetical protein